MATGYIGNNDFRGYLNYLSQSAPYSGTTNNQAANALNYVGNDGGINEEALLQYNQAAPGGGSDATQQQAARDFVGQAYRDYQGSGSGGATASGAGSGGAGSTDYSGQLAGLDMSEGRLRGLLGTADTKLDQGLSQLGDSYTQETNKANQGRSRALEDYGYQREDATNRKNAALGKVDTNARTLNDSLRRILGLASGSGSSAFQFAAPNAVAREATRQRSGVMNDTSTDFRNLDSAEIRAKDDFSALLDSLLKQKNTREQELREGILGQKQGIDTQLGDIASQRSALQGGGTGAQVAAARPFADSYDSRQNEINSLFERFRPQVTSQAVNPQQVALSNYTTDRAAINANRQYGTDEYSPYAQLLKKQRESQA